MDGANRATLTETVYPEQTPKTTETNTGWSSHFSASIAKYPSQDYTHGQILYNQIRMKLRSATPIIYTFHLFIGNLITMPFQLAVQQAHHLQL